jgi:hypothetical protein
LGLKISAAHTIAWFLSLAGYYRRFVRYLAHMAAPLYELLKDDVPWVWGPVQSKAFADLKAALTSQPLVVHAPTRGYPISVHTDASEFAIGAVIEQQPPAGPKQVIAYLSHKLKGAQLHYAPHEIKMLAVVTALKEWRHYLAGHKEPGCFTLPYTAYRGWSSCTLVADPRQLQLSPHSCAW